MGQAKRHFKEVGDRPHGCNLLPDRLPGSTCCPQIDVVGGSRLSKMYASMNYYSSHDCKMPFFVDGIVDMSFEVAGFRRCMMLGASGTRM